jgi:transposase-like protein
MAEITMIQGEKGKSDGGSKNWRCNHCKKEFQSSLTRVRVHLLGALPGKKPQIQCCSVLLNDVAKT